jgi:hypothetical protein
LVVASVGNIERVFLEFERGRSSFCFHDDHFPFVNGMKHHKHWELIGWFLLLAQQFQAE